MAARLLGQSIACIAQPTCRLRRHRRWRRGGPGQRRIVDQRALRRHDTRRRRVDPAGGSGAGLTSDTNSTIRGTTDLDGDGQTDLLGQQVASGELSTWFMNGTTLRSGELLVPLATVTDLL